MDLGADLGYAPAAPTPAPAQGGADPYAGMTDAEVAGHVSQGTGPNGEVRLRMYNPDNPDVIKHIANAARADVRPEQDLGSSLGYEEPKAITKDSTNAEILGRLGYSGEDITKLKDDPAYKAFVKLDGENFLAKDIAEPGSLVGSARKIPSIGAFLHGANESAFGTAQLLVHAAHAIGAAPDTTPALFDALAKFNELEYQQGSGTKPGEYTVPKILGGIAAGMGAGGLARGAAAAGGRVAAGAASAPASALVSGARLATNLGQAGAAGGIATAAMTPTTSAPSEISQAARDEYWKYKGEDAKAGALWTLGMHGLMKTMFSAGLHLKNKTEVAARIKNILANVRKGAPQGAEGYHKTLDELEPLFHNPEYAERELNFAQQGFTPTLGDVTHTGFAQKTERAARSMPFGIGKFRHGTQQPELAEVSRRTSTEAFDRMINTKWGGRIELEKAAKGTGRHAEDAKRVLELMDAAGTDAAKILQAGGKAENIRKLLIKEKLYQARDALAGRAAVSVALPLEEATRILKNASHASVPNKGFMADIGAYATALSDPAMPKNYASFVNDIHNVESLVQKYGAGSHEGQQLLDLKKAYQTTLKNFTDNVNKYAKAERYGIKTKDMKPAFVNSAGGGGGGGYTFKIGDPIENVDELIGRYKVGSGERTLRLKSPIVIEGKEGAQQFAQKLGKYDDFMEAATQYAKGSNHDALVFTENGVPQEVIDLTKWKKAIGDAENRATKFYKETYRPAIDSGTTQAMRTSTPDEIFNQFIQKGKENRAQNFFDSLDAKGRASIQYELIKRAVAAGSNADGEINPGKVADYLFKNKEASGVFFKGEQKWALDGFLKLMQNAREANPNVHGGGHGAMGGFFVADAFLEVIRGIAEGNAPRAVKGAVASAAGLAGAGKALATLTTNPTLRHYMLAASDAAPGSPKLQKIYEKFSQALTLAMAKSVGETSGEKQ